MHSMYTSVGIKGNRYTDASISKARRLSNRYERAFLELQREAPRLKPPPALATLDHVWHDRAVLPRVSVDQ